MLFPACKTARKGLHLRIRNAAVLLAVAGLRCSENKSMSSAPQSIERRKSRCPNHAIDVIGRLSIESKIVYSVRRNQLTRHRFAAKSPACRTFTPVILVAVSSGAGKGIQSPAVWEPVYLCHVESLSLRLLHQVRTEHKVQVPNPKTRF